MQRHFASDDWCCLCAAVDLRPGGKQISRMDAKDWSFGFDFKGTFEKVDHLKSITLVLIDGRRSRATFDITARGTIVRTTFDAEDHNPIDMQ